MALSIAHHGYVMETGRVVLDKPAAALLKDDDVREFYLGLHPARTVASPSATPSTTGARSGGRHEDQPPRAAVRWPGSTTSTCLSPA